MKFKEFEKLVNECSTEWNDYLRKYPSSCGVTCEFSTDSEDLEDKIDYLSSGDLVNGGYWRMFKCDVCKEHNPLHKWHVEIVLSYDMETFHKLTHSLIEENTIARQYAESVWKEIEEKEFYPKGTLASAMFLIDNTVESPEQHDEYRVVSRVSDYVDKLNRTYRGSYTWDKLYKEIMENNYE